MEGHTEGKGHIGNRKLEPDIRTAGYGKYLLHGTDLDGGKWEERKRELSRQEQVRKSQEASRRNSGGSAGGWNMD